MKIHLESNQYAKVIEDFGYSGHTTEIDLVGKSEDFIDRLFFALDMIDKFNYSVEVVL